jgi:uncharacterized membrane-anchored protein YhcB (DUF1043 family)
MSWVSILTLSPTIMILFYIAIFVFIIRFSMKVLKNQKENNEILKKIYNKLDQKN